jgi:chaperonin GroES
MASIKFAPLYDRVLVRRIEEESKVGSIIIPDTAKEKPLMGEVLAAGPGKLHVGGTISQMAVKPGDKIYFLKYSGQEIKVDGEELLVIREDEIVGIVK